MLRRSTKIQLILFVIITLVGISYVSAEYVGLTKKIFGSDGCTPKVDLADSGGIFTNAEVTYRGVTIGQVGAIELRKNGIRVSLDLDDCTTNRVPQTTRAVVANRSVVGEQYVDLVPKDDKGPYLDSHTVIPQSRTQIPIATNVLLTNLNQLLQSLPLNDLRTTVSELGQAFNGRGDDLGRLLDASNSLLTAAQANLPDTIALIENSQKVLDTQLASQPALQQWTHSLRLLSQQLKTSDPDIRRLFASGPTDLQTVQDLITNNRTDLGVTLANLSTVGQLVVNRLDGVEQVLELYPALAAGGKSVITPNKYDPGKNYGALGLVITNLNDPPDCGGPNGGEQGYNSTTRRQPTELSPIAPNVAARCTVPASSGTNVRGSANVPGGDPISTAMPGTVYPRVMTQNTAHVDTSLLHTSLGDGGWLAVLTASLR